VLFADLKGSMELLADRDPEEARALLDPVLEHMMEAVHRYEGTVSQVMGDGIMALFGAPLAHEAHALRACYAALRMQESVKRYAEEMHRSVGLPILIRVGLNSGEVVVRSIGSDLRMDYTAVGPTTHLAARMEQMAMPGSILIAQETQRLVEGYVITRALGPRPVKGLEAPVEVWEVVGAGTVRSRLHAAAARGFTRFVGRQTEVDELRRALEQARAGQGQMVAVVGDPGVGKSRLFWEFTHSDRTRDCLILESSSVSYGRATAYLPIIDLLKRYFQIEARDETAKIADKVSGKLLSLDRALQPSLTALLWLLDVPAADSEWQLLDPPQRRQRTLDAIERLLLVESRLHPVIVVFEDLHWIDAETQALLDSLVESLPAARLLLLVNYRPEYQHGWSARTDYRPIRVDPLRPENAEELLHALLGPGETLEPLKRVLIDRTEGNPFFLEESVRTLVETRVLTGEPGAYHLARTPQSIQIPATATAILASRIDRLSPEDKRLLQAASVIGKEVRFSLLQAIAEESEDAVRSSLARLQAAEFLYETQLFPDLEYTFRHSLTHEVAYGSLLQDRRRALHTRIVEVIERLYADRLHEHAEELAQHSFRSEVWDKAVVYLRQAGIRAFDRSANREAVTWYEQALAALGHLPESRLTLEQAIDIRFDLRSPLLALGEFGRLRESLREAERLAQALGDQRRLGWVLAYLNFSFLASLDYDLALDYGRRALAIAEAIDEIGIRVVANLYLGLVDLQRADYRRAIESHQKNVEALTGHLVRERFGLTGLPAVFSRTWLAWSLAEQGRFAEAIACGEDGVRIADAVKHPYNRIYAACGVAYAHLRRGDLDQTMRILEQGLMLCQATDIRILFPYVAAMLGATYARSGRVSEAIPLLEKAVETALSLRIMFGRSLLVGFLAEGYLQAGRTEEAAEVAARAHTLSLRHSERGYEAWTLRLIGEVASRREARDFEAAEDSYRRAQALAEHLGMRPLLAHCHLGLARLCRARGETEEAVEHFERATELFREMDMRFWLERTAAEDPRTTSVPGLDRESPGR